MKPLHQKIMLYGLILAAAVIAVEWLEFQFFLKQYTVQMSLVIFGIISTAAGIFIGHQLTRRKPLKVPEINQPALGELGISEREQAVLKLLAAGSSNQEIADQLFISTNTVKTHLKRLYEKLEVNRRGQAVQKARSLQLIPP